MLKKYILVSVLALALIVGVGAISAQAVTLTLGAGTAVSSGALTLTGAGASTWSTSAGALTVDSFAALNLGTSTATSVVIGSSTALTSFGGKITGSLYNNDEGGAVTVLRMHNHLTTAGVGSAEFKGESVNNTGNFYGTYTNYDYTPTSASVAAGDIEGSLSNIQLTAGKTMTTGNLVGFTGQAMNVGTLNGAGILQAGIIGSVSGAGANTAVSNIAGVVSSVGADVVNPTAGQLSSFIASNLGTTVIDNALYVQGAATTTNLLNIDASGGMAVVGAGTYSTADGYLVIKVGANTYRVPFFTAVD